MGSIDGYVFTTVVPAQLIRNSTQHDIPHVTILMLGMIQKRYLWRICG